MTAAVGIASGHAFASDLCFLVALIVVVAGVVAGVRSTMSNALTLSLTVAVGAIALGLLLL